MQPRLPIKLIVGLGNPGAQYAGNRHNIGFMVVDELARQNAGVWLQRQNYWLCELAVGTGKLWLLKPNTYMNLSGAAVQPFMRFHKLLPSQLLVVQDDLDLPFGRLRFRVGGSSGGQNGVQDILERLGTQSFARLKIGISRPPEQWSTSNWVLSNFSESEAMLLHKLIAKSAEAIKSVVKDGLSHAQNIFNSTDLRPAEIAVTKTQESQQ